MTYTLDTNFLIDAARIHFPIKEHSDFWIWLAQLGEQGIVTISTQVYEEVMAGNDHLAEWLHTHRSVLVQDTLNYIQALPQVLQSYEVVDEATLERLKADPYVIAHAVTLGGCVVTREIPNSAIAPHNKKISSICMALKVPFHTFSRFMWEVRKTMP
jgi:hypothetical protein